MNMQDHEQVEYRSSVADLAVSATVHCLIGCATGYPVNYLMIKTNLKTKWH